MSKLGTVELNSIVCGDCIEVMRSIPDGSIDIILTSQPYNIGLKYTGFDDKLSSDEFRAFNERWITESYRVMADTGRMYDIVHEDMLYWLRPMAEGIGWNYAGLLTWCKPNSTSGHKRMSGDWNQMTEYIMEFRRGDRTPMMHGEGTTYNWFVIATPQTNYHEGRQHPAQLPLELCRRIISRTPGQRVLDPFCGSASVLLAARGLRRDWIGIELVPEVAQAARNRMNGIRDPHQIAMAFIAE